MSAYRRLSITPSADGMHRRAVLGRTSQTRSTPDCKLSVITELQLGQGRAAPGGWPCDIRNDVTE